MEDHASKTKGLIWVMAACFVGTGFAMGLSPLAHAVPWSWEKKLGHALNWDNTRVDCHANSRGDALLQTIVKRLYPVRKDDDEFSVDVKVVKSSVINAYAGLGGQITINSGLLKQAETAEEVAGVLAHEMGHVHHRHVMQGVLAHMFTAQGMDMIFGTGTSAASWGNYFMNMDFSRAQEAQADEDGLDRLQKAHIDNQGFKHFFERMEEEGSSPVFLSDHPSNQSRIDRVANFPNQGVTPIMTKDEWKILKNYCSE